MHDVRYGKEKPAHLTDVRDDIPGQVSSLPPAYDEADGDGMLEDSFNHVSIPPPAPADDDSIVDIRVDDDANEMFHFNDEEAVAGPSTPRNRALYITPHRASRQVLSHYSNTSYTIKTFSSIEPLSIEKAASQRSDSISSSIGSSSSDAPLQATLPSLSVEAMMEVLPHPDAMFVPDLMRWLLLLHEEDIRKKSDSVTITGSSTLEDESVVRPSALLWKTGSLFNLPKEEQEIKILCASADGPQDSMLEVIESFDTWEGTDGSRLLSTPRDSLQAAIPVHLLEQFQSERLANPRAGFSGEAQFREAAQTLIKIVSNAARGERRCLSVTGRVISQKLGLDETTFEMLRLLGFQHERKDDAERSLLKPPDTTLPFWRVRLRRAWLEIALWYHNRMIAMSSDAFWKDLSPCIPLLPELGSPIEILEKRFKVILDPSQPYSASRRYATPDESAAFTLLGADSEADEVLIEQCYLANTNNVPFPQQIPFFSALQTANQYFAKVHNGEGTDILDTRLAIEKSKGLVSESEMKAAFAKIGLELGSLDEMQEVNNDFILSIYQGAVDNVAANKDEVRTFKDALQIISASRGKPEILEKQVEAAVELSISKAYAILEVQSDTDDDFISSVFAVSLSDSSKSASECTEALRVIAQERKSSMLRKVYLNATGQGEEWEPANLSIPIGLNNIGNTCYLNSVLQYFFAIRSIRAKVITASQIEYEKGKKAPLSAVVRVGGRQIHGWEIERSLRFVKELGQLFSNMISSPLSAVTPERELAYLALVSPRVEEENAVTDENVFADDAVTAEHTTADPQGNVVSATNTNTSSGAGTDSTLVDEPAFIEGSIPSTVTADIKMKEEEQDELIDESPSDGIITPPLPPTLPPRPPLPPRPVAAGDGTEIGQRRNSLMQLGTQQDVSECLDNVMFQIEVALTASLQHSPSPPNLTGVIGKEGERIKASEDENNDDEDVLRQIFLGKTLQRTELAIEEEVGGTDDVKRARGASVHTKREVFTTLLIDVLEEGRDIYDGLDGYFDEEIIDGAAGKSIRRMVTLLHGPAILQIQLQRVQFDRVKGAFKSQAHLETGQSIFMDRYMDFDPSDPEDMIRLNKRMLGRDMRREIARLRNRIQELEPEKVAFSRTLKQTSEFLTSLQNWKGKSPSLPSGKELPYSSEGHIVVKEKGSKEEGIIEEGESDDSTPSDDLISLLSPSLNSFLLEEATRIEDEVKATQSKIVELKRNVEELWKDEQRFEYILASVFMHRGEASHGHYFLNQRRMIQDESGISNVWYKYNDQSVTEASWSDVHRDQSGATPYLLSWVRKDMLNQFDTLCRSYNNGGEAGEGTTIVEAIEGADTSTRPEEAIRGGTMPISSVEIGEQPDTKAFQPTDDIIMADASPSL